MHSPKSDNTTEGPVVSSQATDVVPPGLARHIGLVALIVFGVGDMVGAGIYATIGSAAKEMGNALWLGFITAMVAALLTGLSYASIASRYPHAGGAAFVTRRAYGSSLLAFVVGLAVCASGLTSMAAGANAFSDVLTADGSPLKELANRYAFIPLFLLLLTAVNLWGIRQSVITNIICATVEVGGLVFILCLGIPYWGSVNYLEVPAGAVLGPGLMLSGAALVFFAFIGFEDMLNLAEEVKNPQRNMPIGIVIAILIVSVLYVSVAVTVVSVVPYANLANPKEFGPALVQVTGVIAPWLHPAVFAGITLFAVSNTALINYLMGSRLLYGMARQGLLPKPIAYVHPKLQTPMVAIVLLGVIVLGLALFGNVSILAASTSMLLLASFALVNVALIVLKLRKSEPGGKFEVPIFVPAFGALICLALLIKRGTLVTNGQWVWQPVVIAMSIIVCAGVLYFLARPRQDVIDKLGLGE